MTVHDTTHDTGPATVLPAAAPRLRDVTLRDGLQLTGKPLPTATKVEVVRRLLDLGVPEIEVGSLARPDLVPPLADTLDVLRALTDDERDRCWVWVATPGHVRRAAEAGARRFQYCLSVSGSHGRANIGRTPEQSLAAMPEALEAAATVDGSTQLCLATTFTCPFEGQVPLEDVLAIVADPRAAGASEVVLCDTLGQASPGEVARVVGSVRAADDRPITFHGHDTWGQGVANTLVAWQAGATTVDGSLGGLGGCPFAPGAGGNTSTEDLVFATRPDWLTPETFRGLLGVAADVLAALGETSRSRAAEGARSSRTSFPWAVGVGETPTDD